MRNFLGLAVVLMCAAPALAGDGNVSPSTLKSLGLGQMTSMSDAQGMKVRGLSSNAESSSLSLYSLFLYDPNTGSNFSSNGSGFARATAENAGLNAFSRADVASQTQQTAITGTVTHNGNTFSATVTAFGIQGGGWSAAY